MTQTIAAALAEDLRSSGVRRAFGFPGGGSNLSLIDALSAMGVDFALARTEGGAGFMAAAGAELTGAPGVVIVGNGPGVTSVATVAAHALLDRVPLVIISDTYTREDGNRTGHQEFDQAAMLAPVVKATVRVDAPSDRVNARSAIALASAGRPGPVHLSIGRGAAESAATSPSDAEHRPACSSHSGSDDVRLDEIASAVQSAGRVVVIVGLDGRWAGDALRRLAERLGALVLTTYKAKGALPAGHRLVVGVVTGGGPERGLLGAADVVLTIGLDEVELLTWFEAVETPFVSLAEGEATPRGPHVHRGPVSDAVLALVTRLGGEGSGRGWTPDEVADARRAMTGGLDHVGEGALTATSVVRCVQRSFPEAIVTVDAGAHMLPAAALWNTRAPAEFLISNGLATMGFAIPAAIGAALERPGRDVVALTGDGGFAYHGSELETAQRLGARVVTVVFNDSSLSLIRVKQVARGGDRRILDFGRADFAQIARGWGVDGFNAEDEANLAAVLAAAAASRRSSVVDVALSGSEYGDVVGLLRG